VHKFINTSKHSPVGKEGGEPRKRRRKKVKQNQIENKGKSKLQTRVTKREKAQNKTKQRGLFLP